MSPVKRRLVYLGVWIVGLILLFLGAPQFINALPVLVSVGLANFTSPIPLICIWTILIFLVFLYLGDGSDTHANYLAPYQAVWTVFSLVMLATALTGHSTYKVVRARVDGDLSNQTLARVTVQQLRLSVGLAHDEVDNLLEKLNQTESLSNYDLFEYLPPLYQHTTSTEKRLASLCQIRDTLNEMVEVTQQLPKAVNTIGRKIKFPTEVLAPTHVLDQEDYLFLSATQSITLNQVELINLKSTINTQLLGPVEDAEDKADVLVNSLEGVYFTGLSIFLWIGALYMVVILLPWILFLLFLYRKRTNRATQILAELQRLDPKLGLLEKIIYQQKARPGVQKEKLQTALNALESGKLFDNGQSAVIDLLANQAFSNFEYLLSLLLLSLLNAIGWYYVFYPQTNLGLTRLIEEGQGIRELSEYMVGNLTPLTLGFVGAYFFSMQMLVRRYLAGDLYPSVFLQAAQRILLVFILSLALNVLAPVVATPISQVTNTSTPTPTVATSDDQPTSASIPTVTAPEREDTLSQTLTLWETAKPNVKSFVYIFITLIAFFAGIFPRWGLRFVASQINRRYHIDVPENIEDVALTKLDGVSIWVEERLIEENVENIESMATAQIEQLVIGTHFSVTQIVDWV
ncbi:MAG: hypothetical protein HYR94_00195, partial [Chloroflexi bacterium]|nr:hypothetical protein [Chloroflexota bacterium]